MYHPQSLFLLALSILVFPSEPSQTQSYTKNKFLDCATTSIHCQDRDWNISYPFRRPSMPPYCGHPMFDVECININSDSILSINISGNHYRVSDINHDKQFIGVSNLDYINDTCPQALYNTTIDISLFKYSVNDLNITMFLNCTPLARPSAFLNISCSSSEPSANKSYYQVEGFGSPPPLDLFGNCSSVVVIPMYEDAASPLVGGRMDLLGVLQDGFGLNWVVDNGWCNDCEKSGGICGNDLDSPNGWACFCSDGSATHGTCPAVPNDYFGMCTPTEYTCGNEAYKVSYPFRLLNDSYFCGHPGFDLICQNDNKTLVTKIWGRDYKVNNIDYTTNQLYVVDLDFTDGVSCPSNFTNINLDSAQFGYNSLVTNATVYLDCPSNFGANSGLYGISCLHGQNSYFSLPPSGVPIEAWLHCASVVYVPIQPVDSLTVNGFLEALKDGFVLTWKVGDGWCVQCETTSGVCGFNRSATNGKACFCPNHASVSGTCKEAGTYYPSSVF